MGGDMFRSRRTTTTWNRRGQSVVIVFMFVLVALPMYGRFARVEGRITGIPPVLDLTAEIGRDSLIVLTESELLILKGARIVDRVSVPLRTVSPRDGYVDKMLLFDDDRRLFIAGDYYGPVAVGRSDSLSIDREESASGRVFLCRWLFADDSANRLWTTVTRRWIFREYRELEILVRWMLPDSSIRKDFSLGSIPPLPMFGEMDESMEELSLQHDRIQEAEKEWFPWSRYFVPWDTIGYALKSKAGRLVQINPAVNRRTNPVILPPEGGEPLNAMDFTSEGVGVVVGNLGTIFRTSDFGQTWKPYELESKENLTAVELLESNRLVAGTDGGELLWIRIDDDD